MLNVFVETKEAWTDFLMSKANVVACGVGYRQVNGFATGQVAIVVSVERKVSELDLLSSDIVPRMIDNIPTDVQETGVFKSLEMMTTTLPPEEDDRTVMWRPAPGGVSIGHKDITAGTLGCLVTRGGEVYILSNNHVLANSNAGEPGDTILQPGPHDLGDISPDEAAIAYLSDFVPIEMLFGADCPIAKGVVAVANWLAGLIGSNHRMSAYQEPKRNLVDAAIAKPLSPGLVTPGILEVGVPNGTAEATLGMNVLKSGRMTGLNSGMITQISVTANVMYPNGIATFEDQVMATPMAEGGDSGSIVVDARSNRVVGLLFGGSQNSTLINKFEHVEDLLGVEVVTDYYPSP